MILDFCFGYQKCHFSKMFLSKVEGDMRRLIQRWKGGREWRGGRQHHFPAKYQTRTPRPSSSDLSVMSKASARCNNNIGLLLAWKNIWWTTVLDHNDPSYFMERYVSHSPIRIHWTSWNFLSWKKGQNKNDYSRQYSHCCVFKASAGKSGKCVWIIQIDIS